MGLREISTEGSAAESPVGTHAVQFYADDDSVTRAVDRMVGPGLAEGAAAILIATSEHRRTMRRALARRGANLAALAAQGRLVVLDAAETLQHLVIDNHISPAAFDDVIGGCVRRTVERASPQPVRAFGEMVALLHDNGHTDTALELETRWTDLLAREPLSLLCAYPAASFAGEGNLAGFIQVCGAHDHLLASDRGAATDAADARLHALSRIDQVSRAPVALRDLIQRAGDDSRSRLVGRGQILSIDVPDDLAVYGEETWLTRLFVELFDNASKFSPVGGAIVVRAEGRGAAAVSVISDDGVGIAPAFLAPMFDPFVRPDQPLTPEPAALGLGLTIARRIAELHGGTVSASSDGRCLGARIVVTLPRA